MRKFLFNKAINRICDFYVNQKKRKISFHSFLSLCQAGYMRLSSVQKILMVSCCVASSSLFAQAPDTFWGGSVSGNVGIVSQYVYRGGVENNDPAVQGGLEYAHPTGFAVGYWGSTLDYDATDDSKEHGFEHDFYVAYAKELNQDWAYRLQTTSYVYQNGGTISIDGDDRKTTAFDVLGELSYRDFSLALCVLLADASFGNAGDSYINASYSYELPQNFMLNTAIGFSLYNDQRDDAVVQTRQNFAFNDARIGLSKEIADTGLTASFDYVMGGEDRYGDHFDNNVVMGLNYSF